MSNCDNCPSKGNCSSQATCQIENNPNNHVKKIVGVMSGKGGVGKSTLSVLIAKELTEKGYRVGVLDADITGPSIPRLLQVSDQKMMSSELGLMPVETQSGIKVVSLNLLMEDEEQPVIWRGPVIAGAVKQFWTDVYWGELDYLIIDMPPGTGDVALTVMQSIPINGIVMVSVPQDLVSMIVAKAVNMVRQMGVPIIGIVENMSYIICPDCGKRIQIFDSENTERFLKEFDIQLLGELPTSRELAGLSKAEEELQNTELKKAIRNITEKVIHSDKNQ